MADLEPVLTWHEANDRMAEIREEIDGLEQELNALYDELDKCDDIVNPIEDEL